MKDIQSLVGHITSNPSKLKIMEIVKKKQSNSKYISKHARIPENVVKNLIKELVESGLISQSDEGFYLTEKGEEVYNQIKGMR